MKVAVGRKRALVVAGCLGTSLASLLVVSSQAGATAPAPAPPTSPACIYTPADFAQAFLNAIGEPQTSQNQEAILAWEMAEGGNWKNSADFNPLNTTQPYDNSTPIVNNSAGVQSYANWDDGVEATAITIENGYYASILSALATGTSAQQVTNAVDGSVWGTKNATAFLGESYNPAAPSWDLPCIGTSSVFVESPNNSLVDYWSDGGAWSSAALTGAGTTNASPGVAIGPNGAAYVAVQGPNNALWVYWETASGQWQGPLGVGSPGSTFSSPAVTLGPSGFPMVSVQGPGNQLWEYWELSNGQWQGPLGVGGAGSTNSAPDAVSGPSGFPMISVQGPNHQLWEYWELGNGQWQGPLGVGGAGSTNSAPAVATGPSGYPMVSVQGPTGQLWVYWELGNGQWQGPLGVGGIGSTNGAPAISTGPSGYPMVSVQGPGNQLWVYWELSGGQWQGPLGVGGAGSTNAAPAITTDASGMPMVSVQGPGNQLWVYWELYNGQWQGPLGVGGTHSVSSSPTVAVNSAKSTVTRLLMQGALRRAAGARQRVAIVISVGLLALVTGCSAATPGASTTTSSTDGAGAPPPSTSTTPSAASTTSSAGAVQPASGTYADGVTGTPHYVIDITTTSAGNVTGSLKFIFQDGTTTQVFTFTGTAQSGSITLTASGQYGKEHATYTPGMVALTGCTSYLQYVRSNQDCSFTLAP